jgi:hypothetical protein
VLQNGPQKLPPFNFDADQDPAFHFDADADADLDPAPQNDADLHHYCKGCRMLFFMISTDDHFRRFRIQRLSLILFS